MNCTKRTVPQFEPTAYEDFLMPQTLKIREVRK